MEPIGCMTCNLVPNHPILLLLLEKQKVHSIPVMAADPANFDEEEEAELLIYILT
jgi:hypothetical protein